MLLWHWRYIPCKGVKLDFDELEIYPKHESTLVHLRRRDPKKRIEIKLKHIDRESDYNSFKLIDDVDFEVALKSPDGDGRFALDPVHVFSFLLMIRTGGWINAPAILTHSVLDQPESDSRHVFCERFIDAIPNRYRETKLTLEDAQWISTHMDTGLRFTHDRIFQNAMQSLTSYHCIPYANACLLLAWSGLEALFRTEREISFRLALYISNFLRKGSERETLFEQLRQGYNARSKAAHGASTKVADIHTHAEFARDILRECLLKCIETKAFPEPKHLTFGG
ncbi:HEPN domain-containing protein [Bradyrhizobium sp. SZCCHNR1015]|uniref:HEPN domain-containing protein n=1 Tax=Bradyrhizobium sp. SZCCHNR1015 TaxID=3057338 RepID=UPI002916A236|nr:HEPN domain-containing protein [Bradyrhizobium sp. SZCCHNR1015]